jgi:anti-sigma factor RsiW
MKCNKIKIMLSAYFDGELKPEEEKTVIEHLKSCGSCAGELEYLKQTRKLFARTERIEPGPFFETRLFNRIEESRETIWSPLSHFRVLRRLIPAFAAVAVIVLGVFIRGQFISRSVDKDLILTDMLYDSETEKNFKSELSEIYYNSAND